MDQKEAYRYTNYIRNLHGSTLKIVPVMPFQIAYTSPQRSPHAMAASFMEKTNENTHDFGDFFTHKKELAEDKVNLVMDEIDLREGLKCDNLTLLYEDLLRIDNWRLERPFPENYNIDRIWSDLNRSELQIREQIRREMKDSARDTAFPQKDLRESLLEFKVQNQKNQMMEGDLEMGLDSTYQTKTGGINPQEGLN